MYMLTDVQVYCIYMNLAPFPSFSLYSWFIRSEVMQKRPQMYIHRYKGESLGIRQLPFLMELLNRSASFLGEVCL